MSRESLLELRTIINYERPLTPKEVFRAIDLISSIEDINSNEDLFEESGGILISAVIGDGIGGAGNRLSIIRALVNKGCDLDKIDNLARSAIYFTSINNNLPAFKVLWGEVEEVDRRGKYIQWVETARLGTEATRLLNPLMIMALADCGSEDAKLLFKNDRYVKKVFNMIYDMFEEAPLNFALLIMDLVSHGVDLPDYKFLEDQEKLILSVILLNRRVVKTGFPPDRARDSNVLYLNHPISIDPKKDSWVAQRLLKNIENFRGAYWLKTPIRREGAQTQVEGVVKFSDRINFYKTNSEFDEDRIVRDIFGEFYEESLIKKVMALIEGGMVPIEKEMALIEEGMVPIEKEMALIEEGMTLTKRMALVILAVIIPNKFDDLIKKLNQEIKEISDLPLIDSLEIEGLKRLRYYIGVSLNEGPFSLGEDPFFEPSVAYGGSGGAGAAAGSTSDDVAVVRRGFDVSKNFVAIRDTADLLFKDIISRNLYLPEKRPELEKYLLSSLENGVISKESICVSILVEADVNNQERAMLKYKTSPTVSPEHPHASKTCHEAGAGLVSGK